MLTRDLFKHVLITPAKGGADTLLIVSGYASPTMVRAHFKELPAAVKVNLLVGMTSLEGIQKSFHQAFRKLMSEDLAGRFECRYIATMPAVHSKVYVWLKNGRPASAFIGSANYSREAFRVRREILIPGNAADAAAYCRSLLVDSISCLDADVEEHIRLTEFQRRQPLHKTPPVKATVKTTKLVIPPNAESVRTTLLTKKGEVGTHSGLNWSQRPGRARPNEAYIPIPTSVGKSGFFPPKGEPFTLVTDDGQSIEAVIAQQGNKAIHSFQDNTILGRYFRARLGVAEDAPIRIADLRRYGRTDVEFQRVADDTYVMDFSVPSKA